MKRILFSLALLASLSSSYSQSFQAASMEYTFFDQERNRQIPALIYYPSESVGQQEIVANSPFGFPVVGFGHGFTIEASAYAWLGEILAGQGYIVVLPQTEGQVLPAPDHLNFGLDILFCAEEIIRLGSVPGNPLTGKVMPKFAMMGHSMGGGATYLGADGNESVSTTITFAAAETNPSSVQAALNVAVPSLVIAAEEDCVTPPSSNQIPMYENISTGEKAIYTISGASHCNFTDGSASLCYLGEFFPCLGFGPFIERDEQHERILQVVLPWLRNYLYSDCQAGEEILSTLESGSNEGKWTFEVLGSDFWNCASSCGVPDNLSAQILDGQINLDWTEVEDALGYQVQARLNGNVVGSVNEFDTQLVVSQLSVDQPYEFRVRAFCPGLGLGSFSDWTATETGPFISLLGRDSGLEAATLRFEGVQGEAEIHIYSITGEMIFAHREFEPSTMQLPDLQKGIYIATIKTKNGVSSLKLALD